MRVRASAVGAPVGGEVHFEFSTAHEYGAVLLTAAPVQHDSFYHRHRFLSWCKDNQTRLLQYAPEIQKQELWIVTGAHSTPKCSLTVSISKSRAVKVGFGAEAVVAGKLDLCREWAVKTSDQGWIHAGQVRAVSTIRTVAFVKLGQGCMTMFKFISKADPIFTGTQSDYFNITNGRK